jgi:hypothetical protein
VVLPAVFRFQAERVFFQDAESANRTISWAATCCSRDRGNTIINSTQSWSRSPEALLVLGDTTVAWQRFRQNGAKFDLM